jgi:DNA replicative helicase MCM subunit Mcm2 (Cdc46/Mcm family)
MISGKMPQSLTVLTEGESNIDKFRPGDDVHISGVLAYRYDRPQKDRPMQA